MGIVVVCSILADLGTEFSSLEPRLFVHPHRARKPLDPNLTSLLREATSSGVPFASEIKEKKDGDD